MKDFTIDGKKYVRVPNEEFTFRQYEAAVPIIEKYYDFVTSLSGNPEMSEIEAAKVGIDMMKGLHQLKLVIPLLAILYIEENKTFSDADYKETQKLFTEKMTLQIIRGVREDLVSFLSGGPTLIMECSLYSSPTVTSPDTSSAISAPTDTAAEG